ncbi:MAG: ADP-ribosylglycohydrolase family protein, partial [Bacteroidia bacterium]|nr:ADP-ribosylglycohydrolase family protein [Bacteroidia bacterium]
MGMYGAIIGDLAAWTYEHHAAQFFSRLVAEDAELSPEGRIASIILRNLDTHGRSGVPRSFPIGDPKTVDVVTADYGRLPFEKEDSREDCINGVCYQLRENDLADSIYAVRILTGIYYDLWHGATKREALQSLEGKQLKHIIDNCDIENIPDDRSKVLAIYLARAWDSFEKAWDFTSAMRNAVKWNGDRHIICMLTGAIAGAMYGYERTFTKGEHTSDCSRELEMPDYLHGQFREICQHDWANRFFFPKNDALTNVRKYDWTPYKSAFEGKEISAGLEDHIRRAFCTGWDDRYGFYLENGWYYV